MNGHRPRVVIVSHLCPFPPVHGNRSRLVALLKWLQTQAISVTYILQPLDVEEPADLSKLRLLVDRLEVVKADGYLTTVTRHIATTCLALARALVPTESRRLFSRLLRRLYTPTEPPKQQWGTRDVGGDGHIDRWCWPTTCRAVERAVRRDRAMAVMCEYALLSKSLLRLPSSVLKVIDTVEVFFRNRERFQTPGLLAPAVCSAESEIEALGRAELLIAIQKNDADALTKQFPTARVITVPHAYADIPRRRGQIAKDTILYVASSNPFNVHGLREFLAHAWPSIVSTVPSATLRVVGSVPPAPYPTATGVVHVGRVSDAALANEYQSAHLVINPQVAGTGLKIKCVEALSVGCPLVVNRAGADGLEDGEGQAFLVANDWPDFSKQVVRILTDERLRLALEEHARTFAGERFAPDAVFSPLTDALTMAQAL